MSTRATTGSPDLKVKPSVLFASLKVCIQNKIPVFVWGPPGVGKSHIVRQASDAVGKESGQKRGFRDIRLAIRQPVDICGVPVADLKNSTTRWLTPSFFPRTGVDEEFGSIFLDELNSAVQAVQAASYQLVLDRAIGEYLVPNGWAILAAGNRAEDRALTYDMPSALRRRFVHLEVEPDVDDWIKWANAHAIDYRVMAFIKFKGVSGLFDFDPRQHTRSFPTPATWHTISNLLGCGVKPTTTGVGKALITGAVGNAAATEFIAYCDLFAELPTVEEILDKGVLPPCPSSMDRRYGLSMMLTSSLNATPDDRYMERLRRFSTYVMARFPSDFFADALIRVFETKIFAKHQYDFFHQTAEGKELMSRLGPLSDHLIQK